MFDSILQTINRKIKNLPVSIPTILHKNTTRAVGGALLSLRFFRITGALYLYRPATSANHGNINLLVQEKGTFNTEAEYLFEDKSHFSLYRLNRILTKMLCNHAYGQKINQHNYKFHRQNLKRRKLHQSHILRLFPKDKFNALITFNFGDGETGALVEATKGQLRTVCLHKEGVMCKNLKQSYLDLLIEHRDKFRGDLMLVYNNEMKDILLKTGHYNPEMIKVVGAPRFDMIYSLSQKVETPKKHSILAFYPSPNAQLNSLLGADFDAGFTWKRLCKDFHQTLEILAKKFPNTPIIIKAKHRDKNFFNQSLLIHKNISFTAETLAMDLIASSSICLGFNSSALIESAAFGVPTIQCNLGEAMSRRAKDWIIDYGSLAHTAEGVKQVMKVSEGILGRPPDRLKLSKERKVDLIRLVGNADGKAKQRILSYF